MDKANDASTHLPVDYQERIWQFIYEQEVPRSCLAISESDRFPLEMIESEMIESEMMSYRLSCMISMFLGGESAEELDTLLVQSACFSSLLVEPIHDILSKEEQLILDSQPSTCGLRRT